MYIYIYSSNDAIMYEDEHSPETWNSYDDLTITHRLISNVPASGIFPFDQQIDKYAFII